MFLLYMKQILLLQFLSYQIKQNNITKMFILPLTMYVFLLDKWFSNCTIQYITLVTHLNLSTA